MRINCFPFISPSKQKLFHKMWVTASSIASLRSILYLSRGTGKSRQGDDVEAVETKQTPTPLPPLPDSRHLQLLAPTLRLSFHSAGASARRRCAGNKASALGYARYTSEFGGSGENAGVGGDTKLSLPSEINRRKISTCCPRACRLILRVWKAEELSRQPGAWPVLSRFAENSESRLPDYLLGSMNLKGGKGGTLYRVP